MEVRWVTGLFVLSVALFPGLCYKPLIPTLPNPRIVIVGPTGAGKSSLANALLGCDPRTPDCTFAVCDEMGSCTKDTTYGTGNYCGTGENYTVVDTPGFGDSDGEEEDLITEMMDVLENKLDHADTILLVLKGDTTRFEEALQIMIKRMELIFGRNWWNYMIVGVSFWSYTEEAINKRNETCTLQPDQCKDEAWFKREITEKINDLFHINKTFSFVFTDSWSQTRPHINKTTEQIHWKEETGKLWNLTTSREKPFKFKTVDDILEENERQRIEIERLKGIIDNNITFLYQKEHENSKEILHNSALIDDIKARTKRNEMTANDHDIHITNENEKLEKINSALSTWEDDTEAQIDLIHMAPVGTIHAWVTRPDKSSGQSVSLPDGWVRCDGSVIPAPSIWAGKRTPNINGEDRFLRGGSDSKMLTKQSESTKLKDHTHIDNGHTHVATSRAQSHSHKYFDKFSSKHGGNTCGGEYWDFNLYDTGRSTDSASVTVSTTIETGTSNIGRVTDVNKFPGETKPKNVAVIFIMRIW